MRVIRLHNRQIANDQAFTGMPVGETTGMHVKKHRPAFFKAPESENEKGSEDVFVPLIARSRLISDCAGQCIVRHIPK